MFMFVGLDHMRALVYEHCKKLIENLMLLAAQENEWPSWISEWIENHWGIPRVTFLPSLFSIIQVVCEKITNMWKLTNT
jgi:hypothetical protein